MAMPDFVRFRAMTALAAVLMAASAPAQAPAQAPDPRSIDKRVTTLEGQMRAVQRQVFPGGDPRFFAPEAPAPVSVDAEQPGTPAAAPLIELQARVEALEAQQRNLTGQVEELQFRLRQLEEGQARARADTEYRLTALEGKGAPPPEAEKAPPPAPAKPAPAKPAPARTEPAPAASTGAATGATTAAKPAADDLEGRYRAAFALYEARDYAAAAPALAEFAKANPTHPRASNAQYWAGRSIMAEGRYPEAAKLFLAGYQNFPKGQRAAESLLWLGKALTEMKQPKAACQALDQLRTAYPDRLTGALLAEETKARAAASCSS